MAVSPITLEEIFAVLGKEPPKPEGYSTAELGAMWRLSAARTREILRAAVMAGMAEFAGKRKIDAMDGRRLNIPVYRFKPRES